MNYRALAYYEYVELIIPGVAGGVTQTVFTFNDQAQIRTTPIYSICTYTVTTMPVSPLSGTPLVPLTNMKSSFLTLNQNYDGVNKNGIDLIPWLQLNFIQNGSDPFVWNQPMFAGQIVLWDKCFVTTKVALGNTTPLCFVLGVQYGYPQGIQGATDGTTLQ